MWGELRQVLDLGAGIGRKEPKREQAERQEAPGASVASWKLGKDADTGPSSSQFWTAEVEMPGGRSRASVDLPLRRPGVEPGLSSLVTARVLWWKGQQAGDFVG